MEQNNVVREPVEHAEQNDLPQVQDLTTIKIISFDN